MNRFLQNKKRFFVLFFALCLGIGMAYAYDFSAVCSTGQRLYYTITNSTNHYVKVVYPGGSSSSPWNGFNKPTGDMEIPQTVSNDGINYQVTAIEQYTFYECTDLTSVVIPNSVTAINEYAFYGCTGLSELTIGAGVQYVYSRAFWNCPGLATVHFNATNCTQMYTYASSQYCSPFNSGTGSGGSSAITTLTIGEGVTRIPDYAFRNASSLCNAVTVPNSVTYIGSYAFNGCASLPELTIGTGVATINEYAFWGCPGLVTVHFNATNCSQMNTGSNYSVFNGGTTSGGASAITTLTIGGNVTRIPDYAFKNASSLSSGVSLPSAMTYVGYSAFYGCGSMTGDLVFPDGMTSISDYSFYGCASVESVEIPNSVTSIGAYAFYGCGSMTGDLAFSDGMTSISSYSFYGCASLTSVVIPNSVTYIDQYAFYGCTGLSELTIGAGVQYVYSRAFWNCPGLATVHFNATNCTQMYTYASSQYCSPFNSGTGSGGSSAITTLTIGEGVTRIPDYAFRNASSLCNAVTVPNSVTYIGSYAFNGCTCFANLHIPNSVTSIGNYAFTNVNEIRSAAVTPPTISSNTFSGVSLNVPLYVPCDSRFSYQTASYWSNFTNYQTRPPYELFIEANNPDYGEVSVEKYGDCDDLECIVQAVPSVNCAFLNWTKDDVVVSTDMRYTFDFEEETTLVAHFMQLTNHWTAESYQNSMFMIGVVQIDGVEQALATLELGAFCNGECRGSEFPVEEDGRWLYFMNIGGNDGDDITFRLYDHALEQELNLYCFNTIPFEIYGLIGIDDPYEVLFSSTFTISADVNPIGAGTVTGLGEYWPNSTATLTATANQGYAFNSWTLDGEVVSTEPTYTFTVIEPVNLTANFDVVQTYQLTEGWNWWSTYLDITLDDLKAALVEALPNTIITIKSKGQNTKYNNGRWSGQLTSLDVTLMYRISVSTACEITVKGVPFNYAEHPVTIIANGITWLGFPLSENMSISDALSGFPVANGDIIKSQSNNAIYNRGAWRGALTTFESGKGYKFLSNGTEDRTLTFPASAR